MELCYFRCTDYDEKYSSMNIFHGRKLNKNEIKVRFDDEDCDEI